MGEKNLRELCADTGISRRAIQGYEKAGLVSPSGKNKYGHLLYDKETEERIRLIKFYQKVGFTLREISAVIDSPEPVRKEALEKKSKKLEEWTAELKQLQHTITELINSL